VWKILRNYVQNFRACATVERYYGTRFLFYLMASVSVIHMFTICFIKQMQLFQTHVVQRAISDLIAQYLRNTKYKASTSNTASSVNSFYV
jgi:hypothetical protein